MRASWPRILVWSGVAACVAGFALHRLWEELPRARFADSLMIAALAGLLAWPLRRGLRWSWPASLALVWTLALVALTGIVPWLAVLLMLLAALALGGLVAGRERPLLSLLAGLALIAGAAGWLLPVPVHRPWILAPVFALLVVLRRGALHAQIHGMRQAFVDAMAASPRAATAAMVLLGLASTGAWLPTMQYDDLAYHLGLPWQLMLHGRYALDPTHQVWALAPWAGDVLQGIAQLLARTEARGGLNASWLVATAAGLWQLGARVGLSPALRWAVIALYASLPLVAGLLGGMQTETPATAVLVALAVLVYAPLPGLRGWLTGALLFGLLCGLKPLHALSALPLLAWGAWHHRAALHGRWSIAGPASAALATVFVSGSSYVYAWAVAGNPVLPLFNGVFGSPYFDARNFDDGRWHRGFGVDLPWRITFETAHYLEGWPGGFGFLLVLFAGAWLMALSQRRGRGLAWAATLALLLPLAGLQYARYALPGLVLLLPALVLALQAHVAARRLPALLAAACALNLAFQSNSQWMLHTGAAKRAVGALGRDEPLFERYAPERVLAAAMRRQGVSGPVLDLAGASHIEFAGAGRTTWWYAPRLERAARLADADPSGAAWAALLRDERIHEVMLRPASLTPAQRAGLARMNARPALTVGEAQWWRIPAGNIR